MGRGDVTSVDCKFGHIYMRANTLKTIRDSVRYERENGGGN